MADLIQARAPLFLREHLLWNDGLRANQTSVLAAPWVQRMAGSNLAFKHNTAGAPRSSSPMRRPQRRYLLAD